MLQIKSNPKGVIVMHFQNEWMVGESIWEHGGLYSRCEGWVYKRSHSHKNSLTSFIVKEMIVVNVVFKIDTWANAKGRFCHIHKEMKEEMCIQIFQFKTTNEG